MEQWQDRTAMLIGEGGVVKLQNSFVAIAGLGGVGSWAAEALARSGIGHILIIDQDLIAISNINRQIIALPHTVGLRKIDVMAERLQQINPYIKIETLHLTISAETINQIIDRKPDYILDAIDTITAKTALISKAYEQGIPIISAMSAGNRIDPQNYIVADISKTTFCPLAREVRSQLRQRGILTGVKVVFEPRKPEKPAAWKDVQPDANRTRKQQFTPASMVFAPAVCGLTMAAEVVKDLINKYEEH